MILIYFKHLTIQFQKSTLKTSENNTNRCFYRDGLFNDVYKKGQI